MLLHGDAESAFEWSWTLPAPARTRRVYAPDLPGSGESAKPTADYGGILSLNVPDDILHILIALVAFGAYFTSRCRDDVDVGRVPSARRGEADPANGAVHHLSPFTIPAPGAPG